MQQGALKGRRIAALATDGFELAELVVPLKALRAAGASVDVVSLREGRILGMNLHLPARRVRVHRTLADARADDYDGLFIPGGFINPDLLRQSSEARAFVRTFDAADKPIATLCHGPWLLASAGVAFGRTLTSWPGIRDDLVHAGATWLDTAVVNDRNWVSSRGPQDLQAFTQAMVRLFAERATAPSSAGVTSPQRTAPPAAAVTALRVLPRPAWRMAGLLSLVGAGLWTWRRRSEPAPRAGR